MLIGDWAGFILHVESGYAEYMNLSCGAFEPDDQQRTLCVLHTCGMLCDMTACL